MSGKLLITPNTGSTTSGSDPKIQFQGTGNASDITLRVASDGSLSFEGTAGQLFSISNSMSGTIFSANDVSGIPSIEVLDTGLVKLAQYSGSVAIGTSSSLGTLSVGNQASTSGVTNDIFISGDKTGANGYFSRLMFKNSNQSGGSTVSIRGERETNNYGAALTFYTNGTGSAGDGSERLRVGSAGIVSINPAGGGSNTFLDIYGGGSSTTGSLRIGDGSLSSGHT